ncbi:uncharacterized protein ATC70_013153 [Mucor velutinosus]|uniref:Uncharacterized protein n=1 Tax=Mucor velutinosus TaxID=708070 RepID=A0AAN7DPZ9_9FUNG|nr:hypothetical protein ATC70_013153 [Mucor velutinosus]
MKLTNDLSLSLKSFQIIVVSPEFAKWNIDLLRALFLETGWITTKDSNSNSKLMLVPYIEAYLNAFQMVDTRKESFQREAKYMLLSRQTAEEKSKVIYRATCFQMQCAKELLAAGSKKLAFSDFLLVPSILGSKSICLPTIDEALLAASKRILTEFRDNYKTQHGIDMKDELSEDEVCEIATELANITPLRWNQYGEIGKVGEDVSSETLAKDQLQDLREYPIKRFLMDLTQDADVQQYTKAVCDFLQESLEESGSIKGAPDGVRRIILASGHLENQHGFCIEKALLQAKLIKPEDRFTRTNVENGMLHRPLKMAQIANALLPPLIQNEKKSDGSIFSGRPEDGNKNPLPLNSFYLQANIGERLIHFILNKVVKIPSPGNPIELFTALEKTVKMNDILTAASEIMWGHYQQLESDGHLEALITCCSEHEDINLSLGHYKCFTANLTNLINNWFQDKSAITNEELDTHQMVSINKKCSCALKITHRMLLETGLKPAVSSIAGIIVGTTLSIDHFGLYSISALFVKGGANFVDNVYCSDCLQHHLEEKLAKFFHNHHRKLVMYFVEKETEDVLKQYLVKGNYKQINGSTYAINMEIDTRESSFSFGLLNDHSSVYRDIWGIYYPARNWNASYLFKSKYTILNKGNDLPSTGFRRLFLSRWKSASVGESS